MRSALALIKAVCARRGGVADGEIETTRVEQAPQRGEEDSEKRMRSFEHGTQETRLERQKAISFAESDC